MLTVMAAVGYERASIQAIAAAAGLTPGLLHYHFGSKEQILLAVLETIEARITARFTRRVGSSPAPRQALDAWIDAHLALDEEADPRLVACWVQLGAAALRMPAIGERYRALLGADAARLQGIVEAVLAEDGRPPGEAPAITAALLAAVTGAYQLSLGAPALTPPGSAAAMVKRMSAGLLKLR
jgi:TetR/AcrR family transcriptional repressor of bet genes